MKNKKMIYRKKIRNKKIKNRIRNNRINRLNKKQDSLQIIGIEHCLDYIKEINTSVNILAETVKSLIDLNMEMRNRIYYLENYILNNEK